MNAIHEVDWKSRSFLADLYWWIRYAKPQTEAEERAIEAIEFVNLGSEDSITKVQEKKVVHRPSGEEVYLSLRTSGRFHFDAEFHKYPFDRQRLPIILEHEVFTTEDLEFVDDTESYRRSGVPSERWGVGENVRVADLEIENVTRHFTALEYKTDFGDPSIVRPSTRFSRAVLTLNVGRRFGPYLIKILIPLLIILVLAYLVFFIPAEDLEVAAGLTVTSLLACIAFQLTVADDLPEIGYVVSSDRIFHLCYLLIMLAMAETVYTYNLEKHEKTTLANRLETWSRWGYPAIFAVGIIGVVIEGFTGR